MTKDDGLYRISHSKNGTVRYASGTVVRYLAKGLAKLGYTIFEIRRPKG